MIKSNAHTHSTYCDGKNTLEEMIQAAIQKGFHTIGFSGHTYLSFCDDYPMSLENTLLYQNEVRVLKEKYKDQIDVILGIEWDFYSDTVNKEIYEYAIGSVHHIYNPDLDKYYPLDYSREILQQCIDERFNGDALAMAKYYYTMVEGMLKTFPIEIVGHIDLIRKFNDDDYFFDEEDETYLNLAKSAIDAGIERDLIFEINTGGIYRGCREEPYPNRPLLRYIAKKGGKVMINSDSHVAESLDFYFEEAIEYAKSCGITEIYYLTKSGFEKISI